MNRKRFYFRSYFEEQLVGVIGNFVEKADSQSGLEDRKLEMNVMEMSNSEFVETFHLNTIYLLYIFY